MPQLRVPLTGTGTDDDPYRPDLHTSYTMVERHDDGTVTVRVDESYLQPARDLAARLTVSDKVRADALTDDEVTTIAPLFDPWRPGLDVAVGDVLSWDGTLVEVIQAHTTQADWTPDKVPALLKIHRTDDGSGPIPWQPGISVVAGEQVTYEGVTYTVVQGHTTQAGWTPPATPSLFTPVP